MWNGRQAKQHAKVPCPDCKRPASAYDSGYCTSCVARHRCRICQKWTRERCERCSECDKALRAHYAIMGEWSRPAPDIEGRILALTERAAMGLPLGGRE